MKYFLFPAFLVLAINSPGQNHGFPFGQATYRDIQMSRYEKDSTADAVVLNEFGEAYFDDYNDNNLLFEYHVKIKILKKSGLKYADIEIPLYKDGSRFEKLREVKASAFTLENGSLQQIPLDNKNVFTENSKNFDIKKFAIPNVREGSVIEYQYTLESPFIFNFRNWKFQSEIPKVYSEYWASIPGNYIYNTTLVGYLKLSKNESSLIKDCFQPGGGNKADCGLYKFAMKDIPAFVEEDYMTAKSNHLSAINFELSEVKYFDGRIDKKTAEWKDAEQELRKNAAFGAQLRKGKDIIDDHVDQLIAGESDPAIKARKIYDFIKGWYRWDDMYGKYSELGIKKAFDKKSGNVGDINLSLIAALRYAGLNVEPVILSTRENGLPIEVHPVLSDFNYVIAKVNLGDKIYLADATDDFHPFGTLPHRCLNGKGRVLGEEQSYWIDLKPNDRSRQVSLLTLKLEKDGVMRGVLQTTYLGYEAINQRKKIFSHSTQNDYIKSLDNRFKSIVIKNAEITNAEDIDKPLIQKLEVELIAFDNPNASNFLFNPFILGKWEENPFKSKERLYPVDFGTPVEMTTILNLEYPAEYEIVDLPEKIGLTLPNAGGRFLCNTQKSDSTLTFNSSLTISKPVFPAAEYPHLKELFNRILQAQNTDIIFRKKI